MVKNVVGKLSLTLVFALALWIGVKPSIVGWFGPVWPIPILGMIGTLIFVWWQPDGFPFHRGEKGPGFRSAALGFHMILVACLFALGRLASNSFL